MVGDNGHCVLLCHHVSSASSLRGRCFIVLDDSGGWVVSLMVVVGRKKRCGNF